MQSAWPYIGSGAGQRALVYDAKQDMPSLLAGMHVSAPLHLLNPLDARANAWDMAEDVTSPAAALQAATLLIPKAAHDANPFFSNAARHLLQGVLLALILKALRRTPGSLGTNSPSDPAKYQSGSVFASAPSRITRRPWPRFGVWEAICQPNPAQRFARPSAAHSPPSLPVR